MPFSHIPTNPGDLIKSEDWNKALNAMVELFGKFDKAAGHAHTGSGENGPPINEAGIANNAISNLKIQDGAISAAKIQNGAITAAQVAAGTFSLNFGIAFVLTLSDSQTIPPPSGFTPQECIFFVAVTSVQVTAALASWSYTVKVSAAGTVSIVKANTMNITVSGLALAKKGGW